MFIPYFSKKLNDSLSKWYGKPVASIGPKAFAWNDGCTKVTIPGSVRTIGEEAFAFNMGLTEIVIPEGVETIMNDAFPTVSG